MAPPTRPPGASDITVSDDVRDLALVGLGGAVVGLLGAAVLAWLGSALALGLVVGLGAGIAAWAWRRGPLGQRVVRLFGAVESVSVGLELPLLGISGTYRSADRASRALAWDLHVELATRIATQPLADEVGLVRSALGSLYRLYAYTRERLHEVGPPVSGCESVHGLAVALLNGGLRDFLARWHPRVPRAPDGGESGPAQAALEADWDEQAACREALRALQGELRTLSDELGRLARGREIRSG